MMAGSSSSQSTLIAYLAALIGRYREMEDEYCALGPITRRDVYGPFPEARFYCAAILQWRPSYHSFRPEKLFGKTELSNVVTTKTCSSRNELCPIWISFFDDIRQISSLLKKEDHPTTVSELLHGAESKADWVESILQDITSLESPPIQAINLTFNGWNGLCLEIMPGELHKPGQWNEHEPKPPISLATAVGKAQKGSVGMHCCNCGHDLYSRISTNIRRWFEHVPQPFMPDLELEMQPKCVAWLFTDYNQYGQYDPDKSYLNDVETDQLDPQGVSERD